jgi:hypothetical protein
MTFREDLRRVSTLEAAAPMWIGGGIPSFPIACRTDPREPVTSGRL